nr:MAG TPA: hypothetical protein [Caudoviricetes sp.]
MIASINLKALSGAILAAMSVYIPASVPAVVDRIEQDGGDRVAVVEIADRDTGDILFCDIDNDTLVDDEHLTMQRLSGKVVNCEIYSGNWYAVSVAVGDEVHSVIEGINYPVGAVVWAYMYNGDMQIIAIQHQ